MTISPERIVSILERHGISENECIVRDIAALTADASAIDSARAEEREACAALAKAKVDFWTAKQAEYASTRDPVSHAVSRLSAARAETAAELQSAIRARTTVAAETGDGWRTMFPLCVETLDTAANLLETLDQPRVAADIRAIVGRARLASQAAGASQ